MRLLMLLVTTVFLFTLGSLAFSESKGKGYSSHSLRSTSKTENTSKIQTHQYNSSYTSLSFEKNGGYKQSKYASPKAKEDKADDQQSDQKDATSQATAKGQQSSIAQAAAAAEAASAAGAAE